MAKTSITYLSPEAFEAFKKELRQLLDHERPQVVAQVSAAAALGDRSENAEYIYGKRRLREIDRRVRFLQNKLEKVEIVDESLVNTSEIRFLTWVKLKNLDDDVEKSFQIVGPDELDMSGDKITFTSPLGKVLLGKKAGQIFTFKGPKGDVDYEVLALAKSKAELSK